MERDGLELVAFEENAREKVLPRVLLHVIEAPGPIDSSLDLVPRPELPLHEMPHSLFALRDGDDLAPAERSAVVGLPARLGIEEGPVEIHGLEPLGRACPPRDPRRLDLAHRDLNSTVYGSAR